MQFDFSDAPTHTESAGGALLPEGTLALVKLTVNPHNVSTNPPTYDRPGVKNPARRSLHVTASVVAGPHVGASWHEYLTTVNPEGQDDRPAFKSILEASGASPQNPGGYRAGWGDFDGKLAIVKTKVEKGTEYDKKGPDGRPTGEKGVYPDKTRVALWVSPIATDPAHAGAMQQFLAENGGRMPTPVAAGATAQQQGYQQQPSYGAPPAHVTAPMGHNPAPQQPQQGYQQQQSQPAPAGMSWPGGQPPQHTASMPQQGAPAGWPMGGQQ